MATPVSESRARRLTHCQPPPCVPARPAGPLPAPRQDALGMALAGASVRPESQIALPGSECGRSQGRIPSPTTHYSGSRPALSILAVPALPAFSCPEHSLSYGALRSAGGWVWGMKRSWKVWAASGSIWRPGVCPTPGARVPEKPTAAETILCPVTSLSQCPMGLTGPLASH